MHIYEHILISASNPITCKLTTICRIYTHFTCYDSGRLLPQLHGRSTEVIEPLSVVK